MEYYAKSPAFMPGQKKKDNIIEKLDGVISRLFDEFDGDKIKLLQQYRDKLLKENENIEPVHKTLKEHLDDTVRCAESFFDMYGQYFSDKEKKLILDACRLHDIGKANYIFQTMVNPALKKDKEHGKTAKTKQIPHGFLSALILSKEKFLSDNPQCTDKDFEVLLTSIYYHHDRENNFDAEKLKDYCEQFYLEYVKEYLGDGQIKSYIQNRNKLLFSNNRREGYVPVDEDLWCEYMLVKGMLNKFDWTVSAGYDDSEIACDITEKLLCRNIEKRFAKGFRPVQSFMIENRNNNVVAIAPTGSGKTEAALMWINGEKGFYTLPLKVSSNAIYRRIKENYEYGNVALLHSDSMNGYLNEAEEDFEKGYQSYEQAKLFSYPLTVCTVDQLFRFVYKALGTEIFAATLKYSKIVIDEIQSYSPRVVAALIFGLSEIKRMGGKFAIITATMPPVLQYFMKKSGLMENIDYIYGDFSDGAAIRHRVKIVDSDFDIDEIAAEAEQQKVLVICNTVSKAQNVYNEIKERLEENGSNAELGLLHSRFIRAHRDILERDIMAFAADNTKTGVWVTTQIVEASLDIDFDILHTDMCTADSLLQRMGRCNRAGRKDTTNPNIIIYNNNSGCGNIYDKDIYRRSAQIIARYDGALFSESDKVQYINEVYDVEKIKKTGYFKQIEKYIKKFKELAPSEYDAKEAEEAFRAIQSITVMPDSIYNANREVIEKIGELLDTPYVDKAVRKVLKAYIRDMTFSLSPKYLTVPQNIIDRDTINYFDIHRTRLRYDFNESRGLGLQLDKVDDEDNFIN